MTQQVHTQAYTPEKLWPQGIADIQRGTAGRKENRKQLTVRY